MYFFWKLDFYTHFLDIYREKRVEKEWTQHVEGLVLSQWSPGTSKPRIDLSPEENLVMLSPPRSRANRIIENHPIWVCPVITDEASVFSYDSGKREKGIEVLPGGESGNPDLGLVTGTICMDKIYSLFTKSSLHHPSILLCVF